MQKLLLVRKGSQTDRWEFAGGLRRVSLANLNHANSNMSVQIVGAHTSRVSALPVWLSAAVKSMCFFKECFECGSVDSNATYIFNGLCNGFDIVDNDFQGSYFCSNYDSILRPEVRTQMGDTVRQELMLDKLSLVHDAPTCVHSLGAVTKSDGGLRPNTDCKRPIGTSINNYMNEVCEEFHFIKVDDICGVMTEDCFFAMVDIKAVYRSVNVNPLHRQFQGLVWNIDGENCYMQDNCLSFGLKCAPWIFSRLSEFVVRCMARRGYHQVFSYLDDFLVVGDTRHSCQEGLNSLPKLLRELGFYIAWKKVVRPSQLVTYLGIQLDSVLMEISLPEAKLRKVRDIVQDFKSMDKCTKRHLKVLHANCLTPVLLSEEAGLSREG